MYFVTESVLFSSILPIAVNPKLDYPTRPPFFLIKVKCDEQLTTPFFFCEDESDIT